MLNEGLIKISLNPRVTLAESEDNVFLNKASIGKTIKLSKSDKIVQQLIDILSNNTLNQDEIWSSIEKEVPESNLIYFFYILEKLHQNGFLLYTLQNQDHVLATLEWMTDPFIFPPLPDNSNQFYRLSRFSYSRYFEGKLLLESPLSSARLTLHDPILGSILHHFVNPCSAQGLEKKFPTLNTKELFLLLQLLLASGAITPFDKNNSGVEEDQNVSLLQWEFHDLLFHSRIRRGRHDFPCGATYRFKDSIPILPTVKPHFRNELSMFIQLSKPTVEDFKHDMPFQEILEARKSIRQHNSQAINLTQLSEFLYRSARIKTLINKTDEDPFSYPFSQRPYPGGGAMYELELYLAIHRCHGLEPGLYHYEPCQHLLEFIPSDPILLQSLLQDAAHGLGTSSDMLLPDILIIISARFPRISWKYQSIAYATTLKNVGVLYQTFYLVATAMNLAPCAIGGGNADLFAKATGFDYYAETSVGEFMLGAR